MTETTFNKWTQSINETKKLKSMEKSNLKLVLLLDYIQF